MQEMSGDLHLPNTALKNDGHESLLQQNNLSIGNALTAIAFLHMSHNVELSVNHSLNE